MMHGQKKHQVMRKICMKQKLTDQNYVSVKRLSQNLIQIYTVSDGVLRKEML